MEKRVFCWGSFDRLHKGHLEFLKDAKSGGSELFVIVIADKSVSENKQKIPAQKQSERARALLASKIPDHVVEVGENLAENLEKIAALKPDVFVFGYDQQTEIEERLKEFLKAKGLKTEFVISREFAGGIHSSRLAASFK